MEPGGEFIYVAFPDPIVTHRKQIVDGGKLFKEIVYQINEEERIGCHNLAIHN